MAKYWVKLKVEGRMLFMVDANNVEEAIEEAEDKFATSNLNEMEDIDTEPVYVDDDDDDGDFVWETGSPIPD